MNPYLEVRELTQEEIVEEYKRIKKELSEKDKRIKELEDGIYYILQMAQGLNADELYDLIEKLK